MTFEGTQQFGDDLRDLGIAWVASNEVFKRQVYARRRRSILQFLDEILPKLRVCWPALTQQSSKFVSQPQVYGLATPQMLYAIEICVIVQALPDPDKGSDEQ